MPALRVPDVDGPCFLKALDDELSRGVFDAYVFGGAVNGVSLPQNLIDEFLAFLGWRRRTLKEIESCLRVGAPLWLGIQ